MSDFLKSLRHSDFDQAAAVWRSASAGVDLSAVDLVSSFPGAPSKASIAPYGILYEEPARQEIRALVLQAALTTYAKALEAAESALACRERGLTASSILLTYDAAFLAARSFVMFSGFAPIERNSEVTVDVMYSYSKVARDEELVEDNFAFFISDRWEHKNLWALTFRVASTTKRTDDTEEFLKEIRKDKLKDVSNIRNKQTYGTALYAGDDSDEADFPDALDISAAPNPITCSRYRKLFQSFSGLSMLALNKADLKQTFEAIASSERQEKSKAL